MRIALIADDWGNKILFSHSSLDPISIEVVAGYLQDNGFSDFKLFQRRTSPEIFVNEIESYKPDILAVSANFITRTPGLIDICRQLKSKNDHLITIWGGFHPDIEYRNGTSENLLKFDEIDILIPGTTGNALVVLKNLLTNIEKGSNWQITEGALFRTNDKIAGKELCHGEHVKLPKPYRDSTYLRNNKIIGVTLPSMECQRIAATYISMGCSAGCTFCPSRLTKSNRRSPADVVNEMMQLKNDYGINYIYFTDPTFNAPEARNDILDFADRSRLSGLNFTAMLRVIPDEELFRKLRDAGGQRFAFGVETLNPETKKEYGKNIDLSTTIETFRLCDSLGITTRAFLIFGALSDSFDSINETLYYLTEYVQPDEICVKTLTPVPGTPEWSIYSKKGLLNRISVPDDWNKMGFDTLIFDHPSLSNADLIIIKENFYENYYQSSSYKKHVLMKIEAFPILMKPYYAFFHHLNKQHIFPLIEDMYKSQNARIQVSLHSQYAQNHIVKNIDLNFNVMNNPMKLRKI